LGCAQHLDLGPQPIELLLHIDLTSFQLDLTS
jgi:hypothetical protein